MRGLLVAALLAVGCGGGEHRVDYLGHECITQGASFPSTPECVHLGANNCFVQTDPAPAACVCISSCG